MSKVIGLDGKTIKFNGVKLFPNTKYGSWIVYNDPRYEGVNPIYNDGGANYQSEYLNNVWECTPSNKITTCNRLFYNDVFFPTNNYILKITKSPDTSKVTDFSSMFDSQFTLNSIVKFNTSNGIDFNHMFYNCNLTTIPLLDTGKGTDFSYMFYGCAKYSEIPLEIPLLNTSNGTNFSYMFGQCLTLNSLPLLDTSNGTDFSGMFWNCTNLTEIPLLNTSNGTDFSHMFEYCRQLTEIPLLDFSNGINFRRTFYDCFGLLDFPSLDFFNGDNYIEAFEGCRSIKDPIIPIIEYLKSNKPDIFDREYSPKNTAPYYHMFYGCLSASDWNEAKQLYPTWCNG